MERSDVTSRLRFQPLERTGYSEVLFEPRYSCYEVSQVLLPGHALDLRARREDARTLETRPLGAVSLLWTADSGDVPTHFITNGFGLQVTARRPAGVR